MMGVWKMAATRLGLAGRSFERIRGTLASKSETRLFLFLHEIGCVTDYKTNMVVGCIGLDTATVTDVEEEEELPVVANKESQFRNGQPLNCFTLGSKILVPIRSSDLGFTQICWIDACKPSISFQVSSPSGAEISNFTAPRYKMRLGEIDDKLYCLDYKCNECDPHFEVFDPKVSSWKALEDPHFVLGNNSIWQDTMFFAESKRILTYHFSATTEGMYCFDVTNPSSGWMEVTDPFLHRMIQPHREQPFFIHNYHHSFGNFYLLFTLDFFATRIEAGFMSNTCDFAQPIQHVIQLPEFCSDYLVDNDLLDHSKVFNHKFVRLGAQKFALILNKFVRYNPTENKILLLTYEYDVVVTDDSAPSLDIKSRLLGTRTFQYETMGKIWKPDLLGAFLM